MAQNKRIAGAGGKYESVFSARFFAGKCRTDGTGDSAYGSADFEKKKTKIRLNTA
ncbi:MAG: hypothetical protein LUD83_01070 [Clostridiales bacterium]|nr:hypothetical protein [Clostridiales bacterium]